MRSLLRGTDPREQRAPDRAVASSESRCFEDRVINVNRRRLELAPDAEAIDLILA